VLDDGPVDRRADVVRDDPVRAGARGVFDPLASVLLALFFDPVVVATVTTTVTAATLVTREPEAQAVP